MVAHQFDLLHLLVEVVADRAIPAGAQVLHPPPEPGRREHGGVAESPVHRRQQVPILAVLPKHVDDPLYVREAEYLYSLWRAAVLSLLEDAGLDPGANSRGADAKHVRC